MNGLRRLAYATLGAAYAQIVFGAIVRISGSGMGCGDHWPDCYGTFTPGDRGVGLLIEISHRYGAALVTTLVVALAALAYSRRHEPGVGEAGGVLNAALISLTLVAAAALFGAVTVKLGLAPVVVVAHLAIAMSLLGILTMCVVRAGGFGRTRIRRALSARSTKSVNVLLPFAFMILLLGALTANIPGASASCQGFPHCRSVTAEGAPLWLHITHRILAFFFLGHATSLAVLFRKRGEDPVLRRAAWIVAGAVVTQIVVAAGMVETQLAPALRSLHQAVGAVVWISVVAIWALAGRAAEPADESGSSGGETPA